MLFNFTLIIKNNIQCIRHPSFTRMEGEEEEGKQKKNKIIMMIIMRRRMMKRRNINRKR